MAGPSSSGASWKTEEDYVLARLAVALGLVDAPTVTAGLDAQGRLWAAGERLSLSQVLVRERRLRPEALLTLKAELAKLVRACPGCGLARYLAPGPQPRLEPCPRCGAGVPVPAAQSLTASAAERREQAFRPSSAPGSARFERDPFVAQGGGPKVFSHYVIEREIARGGMGAVYRARHAETGKVVALKVVLAGERATENQVHRFKREAKAQLELDHPGILKIHEAGEWEGILYYTMDLVEGPDLAKAYPSLDVRERVRLLAEVARAVHHAHARGYVHRDLKPANVLLQGGTTPLVTDFGLAKNLGGETRLTKEGQVLGTPFYMAPEQATGQVDKVGPRSDVYALGVLLYELVTGALPFQAEVALELYRKIVEEAPPSFAERGVLEPALETIAFKAMAKEVEDRYASAEALAEDLERHLRGEAILADRQSAVSRVARRMQKHQRSIGALLGTVVVGLAVLVALLLAGKKGLERIRADSDRRAWEGRASAAVAALDQARAAAPGGEEPAAPGAGDAALRALDEALAAARALLAAPAPAGAEAAGAELRARAAAAVLARAEAALAARTGAGARAAAALGAEAAALLAPGPGPAPAPGPGPAPGGAASAPALLVQARAARRLGDLAAADAALALARSAAPDDPRVKLEEGLLLLDRGGPPAPGEPAADAALVERALGPLDAAAGARETAAAALAAKARALAHLGRDAPAREALARALKAPGVGAAAAQRLAGDALTLAGRRAEAAAAWRAALEAEPGHAPTAQRLVAALVALGRPLDAARAVEPAARAGVPPWLRAPLLRARAHAGEDVAKEAAAAAADDAAAARLAADLARAAEALSGAARARAPAAAGAAAGAAPDPVDDALAARDPVARAARARARAAAGDASGAKADLAALAGAEEDAPRDVPPTPDQARLARDAGWARLLLGEAPAGPAALAAVALRGLPHDPDATALRVRAGAAPPARLVEAFAAERDALDGALGRGVLVARLATLYRPALAREAHALLAARLAGDPALLTPLAADLLALDGLPGADVAAVATPAAADLAPWAGALAPRPAWPPAVDAEARRKAAAMASAANALGREQDAECIAALEETLRVDPNCLPAIWELAVRAARHDEERLETTLGWFRYLERDPGHAHALFLKLYRDWREAHNYRPEPASQLVRECLARDPQDPLRQAADVFERYLGVLYPKDTTPAWTPADPERVRALLDAALAREPRLVALLYVRAHLAALAGEPAPALRDLALASAIARECIDRDARPSAPHDALYRLWVLAAADPEAALRLVAGLSPTPDLGGAKYCARAIQWLKGDPRLEPLRGAPAFQRWVAAFAPR